MFAQCLEEPSKETKEKEPFFQEKLREWDDYISDADDLYEEIDPAWEDRIEYLSNNPKLDACPAPSKTAILQVTLNEVKDKINTY